MGEFEDLVDRASSGDEDAAQTLKEKFGGSALRKQAEEGQAAAKRYEDAIPEIREARFSKMRSGLDESLREVLSLEDVVDVSPDEITADLLRTKAEAKAEAQRAQKLSTAQAMGFQTVEEFEAAMNKVKQEQTTQRKTLEAAGGATASSSGAPGGEDAVEPFDAAKSDYETARKQGATKDVAMGEFVHTLLASQAPVEE